MKSIVFDNAGTIIRRVTALKDMSTKKIFFESNTIGIVNDIDNSLILVFQTPTKKLLDLDCKIVDYLENNKDLFEISYSNKKYTKEEVIGALKGDVTSFTDLKESASALISKYDIEICSGSAIIVNMSLKKILYVYTSGGLFFEDTLYLFKTLKKLSYNIYIASGDNKQSLYKISSILNIPQNNIYHTCNSTCKRNVIIKLQRDNQKVIMVGNNTNDELAIKQADIGILTLEQNEKLPNTLLNNSDYTINRIGDVLKFIGEEAEY